MPTSAMKSYLAKPQEFKREWYVADAAGQVLGRFAGKLAVVLMGKHKPTYTPHCDTGDFVVVINADKIKLTGRKRQQMEHDYYTYYPSGHKHVSYEELLQRHPEKIIELAVRGMLPKSKMGKHFLGKLKCYRADKHPHSCQQPKPLPA